MAGGGRVKLIFKEEKVRSRNDKRKKGRSSYSRVQFAHFTTACACIAFYKRGPGLK